MVHELVACGCESGIGVGVRGELELDVGVEVVGVVLDWVEVV